MITKQAILDAAYRLVEKKDLDKITVTDIVKECHITRQTFYYHFQDLVDLMDWGLQQEMDQLLRKAKTSQSAEEALMNYCNAIMEKRVVFIKIMDSRYSRQGQRRMIEGIKQYMLGLAYLHPGEIERSVNELTFYLDYHAGAIAVMIAKWLQEKDVDMESGVHRIVQIMKGELYC